MGHSYHTLQHWDQWLSIQPLGERLLNAEKSCLLTLLAQHYGKHCALIGVPSQHELLKTNKIPSQALVTPISRRQSLASEVEGDVHELPIFSGSVDLVIIPHTLEFVSNPRHVLVEACRIVKPEGILAYIGFNPFSLWGLKRFFSRTKQAPWSGRFIPLQQIKNWLRLAEFDIEAQRSVLFRYPLTNPDWFDRLRIIETIGNSCFPLLGGVNIIVARAKVIPLTPIRMRWKQKLSSISISPSMSGTIARQSEINQ